MWCISAPPRADAGRTQMGVVARFGKPGAAQQAEALGWQMFTGTNPAIAAVFDNDGRAAIGDDAEGGHKAGRAAAKDEDGLAAVSRLH